MNRQLIPFIVENAPQIAKFRHDIHAHPELAFEEHRTAGIIADMLEGWDIEVQRNVGKTGLVGILRGRDGGASGKAIGLRADMDALAMPEQNEFAHASTTKMKMHGCGHDGHSAMLLSAAQYLASHRNFDGTVYFIFQPAEEVGLGALAMIEDGLFTRYPMESVYGMHNWPGLRAGSFSVTPGPMMASASIFDITIRGKGGHAAMPHLAIDPIPIAAQIVLAFQQIISRGIRPLDSAVISVTSVKSGEAFNVIPQDCHLRGTVRTFSDATLSYIQEKMERIAERIASGFDATVDFNFKCLLPPTVNDPEETALVEEVLADLVGADNVTRQEPTMGGEDFAFMLREKPGVFCFISNGEGDHRSPQAGLGPCELHNSSYDFNDELIPVGASYFAKLVARKLGSK